MADLKKLREMKKAYTEMAVSRGNSTSGVDRAGSAATSGGRATESKNDFLSRLQNETRNLYSQQQSGTPGAASPTGIQGSLYAQIAQQMRDTPLSQPAAASSPQGAPGLYAPAARQPAAMPGLTGAQRQMIAERNNANGPLAASANPNDWSGDAAMYLQAGGDIDRATVRGLDYSQRRFIGDMAGGVRNAVNEAGYLYQSGRESMKDPTKGPNIEEQLLYDFATDPHAMDAYNAWRASLKPGEYETMEMMGQLPSPGQLYVQQRMREMGEEFQANYEEPELKRITNMGENFQKETEQLYGDMTGGWKTAADLAGSIGQQVPAMALRAIPLVGPALSNAYFFGSAAGASTEEAYADGASLQQAVDYGALSGTVEMLTEHVFDGMSGLLGKGAADDAVEGLIHALTRRGGNNALRNGLRWTFGALGEAGEEGISALVDPLLRTVYNNKTVRESYKDLDWEDVWNQVLLGGLSGGVLSSIGLANGQFKGKNAELDARVANEVVNDFLTNTPEGQALAQQAKENAPQEGATEEGAIHGEQGIDGTPENGNDGVRAGEQGTGISELGEEGAVPGGEGQVRESVSEGRGENLRSVTLQELGVTNAAEGASITVQDENSLTGPAASAAQQVRQIGMEPVAYQGDMIVNGQSVNGYIENGKVFFRTDAQYRDGTTISPDAIVRHEAVHQAKTADPGIIDTGMEIVRQRRSEAEVQAMKDDYRETYKDIYDFEKMSEEDITDMLVEEIVADAYAGLNYFRDGGETVEKVRAAIGSQVESAQSIEGQTESTGPPRASVETSSMSEEITTESTDEQRYEILKNKDISAPEVDYDLLDDVEMESLNGAQKSAAKKTLKKIAKRLGINGIDLKNSKITFPFRFSNTNVGVSAQHQTEYGGSYQDFAKVLTCLSDLVDSAELIETHTEKKTGTTKANPDLKQTYVLLGAVKDGEMIIPVQMEVKEFFKNDTGLYMTVTLSKINGSEVISDPTPGEAGAADRLFSDPTYSIRKIIENVNAEDGRFLKYAPDGFLNEEQKVAKQKALRNQAEEYAAYTIDGEGKLTVENSKNQQNAESGTKPAETGRASVEVGSSQNETEEGNGTENVTDRRALEKELQERQEAYQKASDRNDTEYDYRDELARIRELEQRLEGMRETDSHASAAALARNDSEGETTPPQTAQSAASSPEGGAEEMEAARAELLEVGEATVRNETGTYIMKVRLKGDRYQSQIFRNGVLDKSQTFPSTEEAADYAVDWVNGRTNGQIDAELDNERSEQKEKPGPHWPTGKEYGEEIVRQKQNKAADAATQTLRERIRRANEELKALRRLEKTTGLTDQQRAHMNDVQETLDIMNDELTSRKGRRAAKKEKARTKGAMENKPTRSAADAKNALMDQFHTAAGERAEVGRQIEAKLNEIARSGRITDENRQALYDLLIENGVVPKHAESTYQEIRNSLRGQRIFVNEQERADLGDDFETLRRRAWANGIYLTNNPNDGKIDTVNMEMAEAFGENLFPTDEALSDMLSNMIDQAERGRTVQQSLHESIQGEARETGRSANEIYSEMFNQMDETLRTFAEKAGLEVALKDRTATQLAEERQRWEDRLERRAQARRESEVRGKVLRGLQRLSKLRGKAGPEIRAQVDEVLKDIDTQARQITPAGLENLQALQRAYEEAREAAGYVDGENMGNWIPNPFIEERLAALTKKHVNDMSLEEVVDLGRTVAGLENALRTQNQMIGEEFDATIEESAKGVREDVESSKGAKAGFLHKWLMEEHLSPRRFLDMLGGWKTDGTMSKLSKSLEDGQTRMLDYQRRAVQSFDPFLSKKANRQWLERASGKKAEWTSYEVLDGYSEDGGSYKTIELTPMMKISLYLHSRNMDNLRHIQTGGIVIPNKALYQKGKMAEAYAQGERIRMNPETVRKIAGELTETERTFANHMITLFDNISKDAINEVSLQLDGFERAGVENYMPIETDRSFLKSDVAGEARAATVEGIGSIANERVHASNPIMLSDASDVLMRQIDKVSRYYGYAIPIRNFQAVNNFVFHEEGAPFSTSIKEIMDRKWGSGAEQYITKMLEDLQSSGRRGDMMSSALAKLRGNLAGATLMFNPSVAVSQTASYPGAAQAVGWDGLAHGLVAGRVDPKLIEKYSPLYWYRNQGNSTQELGDYMSDKGLEQKLPWIMNWIQKMDSATIRRLWAASEYRVSKDNPGLRPGSQADIDAGKDAYYQKVAEVFNRAVYDTQPNYTNMERAQILRSNSDVTRFLTMYKTVPLQYYGMMVEATGRLQAAMKSGDQAKITEARKYAVNTFGGLLAANTVYVAMKALFKGIRRKDKDYRDEEGNLTAGSVAAQLGKDLAETYAGSIIGGAEMYSVAESLLTGSKFYGPEMSALSYVEDMVGAVNSIFKSIGEEDPRKAAGAIKDAAVTLAQGFGVPAQNVETYLLAGVRWMFPDVAMEYDNLFGGIERGDMKGMDEQAVGTATNLILQNRTGLKIDQSVTDELARLYSVGELAAIPTNTPSSFSYNGKTVQISNRGAYSDTWGGIVGDNLEDLVTTDDYVAADDGQRAALVNKLYQYATVEARRGADPEYSADGNSTYGWTVKADEAVEAGVGLVDAICALDAFSHMTADKDENGNSISGSKKAKVCDYIDAMDITDEQKDVMYLLSGYKENSLEYTPWHGWDEDEEDGSGSGSGSGKSGGKGSGGKRSGGRGGRSSKTKAPKAKAVKGSGKIQLPKVSSGSGTGAGKAEGLGKGADASLSLIQIIDRYYGGNALAAAMDGGARARGRTTVDFEL